MLNHHVHQWTNFMKFAVFLGLCIIIDQVWAAEESSPAADLQKRTWKNLQGGWGKRNPDASSSDSESDYYGSYPGGRGVGDEATYPDVADSELDRLNKYLIRGLINQRLNQLDTQYDGSDEEYPMEKRAWNKMNGGWGKRANAGPQQWNKFRGAWGKREPGWNNLKGLWGKRQSGKWNQLGPSWGKRDSGNSNSY